MSEQIQISDWEEQQAKNAHHRAMILQILKAHPNGLTVQQILGKELDLYGYTFLIDNRLRELCEKKLAESFGDKPHLWRLGSGKT